MADSKEAGAKELNYLKIASALCHEAQALHLRHLHLERLIAGQKRGHLVPAKDLKELSAALRKHAELIDRVSILIDGKVKV